MNNDNKKTDLQFTKLSPDDIIIHQRCLETLSQTSTGYITSKEVTEARQIFCKTFK